MELRPLKLEDKSPSIEPKNLGTLAGASGFIRSAILTTRPGPNGRYSRVEYPAQGHASVFYCSSGPGPGPGTSRGMRDRTWAEFPIRALCKLAARHEPERHWDGRCHWRAGSPGPSAHLSEFAHVAREHPQACDLPGPVRHGTPGTVRAHWHWHRYESPC